MHPAIPIIAQIARADPSTLTSERGLDTLGLSSSLGLSVLRSGLSRRLAVDLGPLNWRMTIGDLLAAVERKAPADVAVQAGSAVVKTARSFGPLGGPRRVARARALPLHGVDIEDIAAMPAWPATGDGSAFYAEHFTAGELAHAGRQASPRATLCGCWCAKEAVKKCGPELLALGWKEIEVVVDDDGRPSVRLLRPGAGEAWDFSLSISHSAASAAASVLACRRDGM